jgi:hypothetical protein
MTDESANDPATTGEPTTRAEVVDAAVADPGVPDAAAAPPSPLARARIEERLVGDRSAALVLAHLHLRLGSLSLARAELETLAGRDALDDAGLVDLTEARWRTGDVTGAGEAAAAILGEDDDGPLVVLVVATEAALLRGRPSEARRYAEKAMVVAGGGIDAVFAGMPRGPVWPTDRTTLSQPAPTLFDGPEHRRASGGRGLPRARPQPAADEVAVAGTPSGSAAAAGIGSGVAGDQGTSLDDAAERSVEPATIALWSALEGPGSIAATGRPEPSDGVAAGAPTSEPELPSGDQALVDGRAALAAGDLDGAASQLALALRLTPALASAVIDAIDGRTERGLAFVRGDAYRLVGREREARRAYADAIGPLTPPRPPVDPPPEGDPA